jgi:hypothetical protein
MVTLWNKHLDTWNKITANGPDTGIADNPGK